LAWKPEAFTVQQEGEYSYRVDSFNYPDFWLELVFDPARFNNSCNENNILQGEIKINTCILTGLRVSGRFDHGSTVVAKLEGGNVLVRIFNTTNIERTFDLAIKITNI
jgi:hypothetical protein